MRRGLVSLLLTSFTLLFLATLFSPSSGRASDGSNLLQNPGFEEGTIDWLPDHDTTEFVTTIQVYSGSWAASLNRSDGVGGQIYIYQDVPVEGGGYYALSGWAYNYKDSPSSDWAMLRMILRNSTMTTPVIMSSASHTMVVIVYKRPPLLPLLA